MKKILSLSLLFISLAAKSELEMRPYSPEDKDAVMTIALQDPMSFFVGSAMVKRGGISQEFFETENKKGMEAILADGLRKKYVMLADGNIVAFMVFCKSLEPNLETMKETLEAQGFNLDEKQILASMPNIKKTKAESKEFMLLEGMAVDKSHRSKGYGKQLMVAAEKFMKELWPTLTTIQLNCNADNEVARKLYQSMGFEEDKGAMQQLAFMEIVVYKKTIA